MSFVDYDEDLAGEAPCEFCGDSYPLILLIEHQTTHLNEGYQDFGYNYFPENEDFPEVTTVETANIEPQKVEEQKQTQSSVNKQAKPLEPTKVISPEIPPKENIPVQVPRSSSPATESKPKVVDDPVPAQSTKAPTRTSETKEKQQKNFLSQIEEFRTEKGEKLLVYGADIDPVEDLESEKLNYKMPNNPLLSTIPVEKDVIDINSLSDDDCDESLEEFWKRARDLLKRNRAKN